MYRLKKSVLVLTALAVFSTVAMGQAWKPGEDTVGLAANAEKDNQKKLDLIKDWEQKFPDSEMKGQRSLMKAQALLGIATAAYGKTTPPELLDSSEKAGKQLTDNLDDFFSAANKPAAVADAQWAEAKKTFSLQSHVSLGWAYYAQKKDAMAEEEFKKVLAIDPNQAQVSYWLGSAIIRQKDVKKYSDALYSIARSLSVTGATALPPAAAGPAETYLKKAYAGYHGDETDLDKLKAAVAAGPLPPADFHVKSVSEIDAEKFKDEAAFNAAHPDTAEWRLIRTNLTGDQAETAFAPMKDAQVPSAAVGMFKGTVVAVNDKDLVVNVDNAGGDGTLKFEKAINQKAVNVGDKIEFKGVVAAYTKEPYMLTMTIDEPKESIKGLPDNAFSAGAATKKAAAPKRAAPKKK